VTPGDFTGMFTITSPANVVLFHGRIELMERVSTHHPPFGAEACNLENHVEGWLIGNGGLAGNYCLRALYVASVLPVPVNRLVSEAAWTGSSSRFRSRFRKLRKLMLESLPTVLPSWWAWAPTCR